MRIGSIFSYDDIIGTITAVATSLPDADGYFEASVLYDTCPTQWMRMGPGTPVRYHIDSLNKRPDFIMLNHG